MRFLRRLWTTLLRREPRALGEELESHIAMRADELERSGMARADALRQARLRFGNTTLQHERTREATRLMIVESFIQDVRYGMRMMRKTPVVTAVAVLSLALGIGANTAIFTVIDALLLRSLPVRDPQQIVTISWRAKGSRKFGISLNGTNTSDAAGNESSPSFSFPMYERFRKQASSVSAVVAFADLQNVSVFADGQAAIARGQVVSGNYYEALGVAPAAGRALSDDDDREEAPPVCTISYRYWASRFALNPDVAGKKITINHVPFTIAGVEPRDFLGVTTGSDFSVMVPIRHLQKIAPSWGRGERSPMGDPENWWVQMVGRLKPPITPDAARAELTVLFRQALPDAEGLMSVTLGARGQGLNFAGESFRDPLLVLMSVVAVVLVIACANVANLLLARAKAREKETAMRLALGAGRGRLARQLLTESVMLAAFGSVLGVAFAYWAGDMLATFNGVLVDVRPDARVLGFTAAVTLFTGILFGLAPAIRAGRADLQPSLRTHERSSRFGLARVLVAAQLALSIVVVVGAGLYIRTLHNLRSVDLGMNPRHMLVFRLMPELAGYSTTGAREFDQRALEALERIPGVESATVSRHIPLSGSVRTTRIIAPGTDPPSDPWLRRVAVNLASEHFFETMGIPVLLGRGIEQRDQGSAPRVAVINETLAKTYFPGQNPIGRHFTSGKDEFEVVGIARDSKYDSIRKSAPPTIYMSYLQSPTDGGTLAFEVRTAGQPSAAASAVRRTIAGIDRNVPVFEMSTEEEKLDDLIRQDRLFAGLASIFGALALLLASIGLYGVRAYNVARRTAEIGIRMALGAGRGEIAALVLRETAWIAGIGLAVGVVGALAVTRAIRSMLFGLAPQDPVSFAAASGVLIVVAAIAGYFPARRASRVDPMVALRHE
jgi:predicted permease